MICYNLKLPLRTGRYISSPSMSEKGCISFWCGLCVSQALPSNLVAWFTAFTCDPSAQKSVWSVETLLVISFACNIPFYQGSHHIECINLKHIMGYPRCAAFGMCCLTLNNWDVSLTNEEKFGDMTRGGAITLWVGRWVKWSVTVGIIHKW